MASMRARADTHGRGCQLLLGREIRHLLQLLACCGVSGESSTRMRRVAWPVSHHLQHGNGAPSTSLTGPHNDRHTLSLNAR